MLVLYVSRAASSSSQWEARTAHSKPVRGVSSGSAILAGATLTGLPPVRPGEASMPNEMDKMECARRWCEARFSFSNKTAFYDYQFVVCSLSS